MEINIQMLLWKPDLYCDVYSHCMLFLTLVAIPGLMFEELFSVLCILINRLHIGFTCFVLL